MSFAMDPEHSVATVYRAVIDEVVSRVKPEFVGEGVDECAALPQPGYFDIAVRPLRSCTEHAVCHRAVLDELRVLWETKLSQSGALDPLPAPAACVLARCSPFDRAKQWPQYPPAATPKLKELC